MLVYHPVRIAVAEGTFVILSVSDESVIAVKATVCILVGDNTCAGAAEGTPVGQTVPHITRITTIAAVELSHHRPYRKVGIYRWRTVEPVISKQVRVFELAVIKVVIESVTRQELFMVTLFDNTPISDHEYEIGIPDRRKPMGDYKGSAAIRQ